ncbi:MAG: DUF5777 family beta-barrel protein [Bacteroidota bacterium]
MKKVIYLLLLLLANGIAYAQDDLLNMLNDEPAKAKPVFASFKSTRIINLHSNETMRARHLDFRIQHRFGNIGLDAANNYGFYNMFGVDGARIRLGLEYGITNDLMVGIGRSSEGKTYDGFVKYKILKQSRGKKAVPFSLNYFGNIAVVTQEWADKSRNNFESSRLSFVNQLILVNKLNEHISVCLSPTVVHYNLVQTKNQPNDIYALGIGTSIKISRSTRFNLEYIPRLNGRNEPKDISGNSLYYDAFAIGFDIETGGHVFQLHFTNASGMIEQQFIAQNTGQFNFSQIRLGFNISRTFSFEH